jgi:hypothetical protein
MRAAAVPVGSSLRRSAIILARDSECSIPLVALRRRAQEPDGRQLGLLRARSERPRGGGTAEQRDELASFQLIELHLIPASRGRIPGYRIGGDQSGGSGAILQPGSRHAANDSASEFQLAVSGVERCSDGPAAISVAHDEAAINVDRLARHVVGVTAGEKAHDASHVLSSFRSAEGD